MAMREAGVMMLGGSPSPNADKAFTERALSDAAG
jgi:hypothetical protein